jgi:hypothetical protein
MVFVKSEAVRKVIRRQEVRRGGRGFRAGGEIMSAYLTP